MRNRTFWFQKVEEAWQRMNSVWLAGIQECGKTSLVQNLPQIEYFDLRQPEVRRKLEHPLEFFGAIKEGRVALDHVGRLVDPLGVLSVAAQMYPDIRVIATNDTPLAVASGEKAPNQERLEELWLTPMVLTDLNDFQQPDLEHRFLRGGLPEFFLSEEYPQDDFQSWLDDYWVHCVHEQFRLESRASFQKFAEMILIDSGEIFESTRYAAPCQVSRTTITNYLSALEKTYFAHILRPFNSRRSTEIIAAPRVYGFDTGFIAFHRGWTQLRRSDLAPMWLHMVLNELHASLQTRQLYYWKDKRDHQVDIVFARRIHTPTAIQTAWSSDDFDPSGLLAFRRQYPNGVNIVVCRDIIQPTIKTFRQLTAKFVPLNQLVDELKP